MRSLVFGLALALASVASATTGPLYPPPTQTPGQFVYVIPPGFSPPGIGAAGVAQIEAAAHKTHHPFYVVIVDRLPDLTSEQYADARSEQYTQSGEELTATYTIDKLAADWAATAPGYDPGTSSIFLLSYKPRQFRVLAGGEWKRRLGLEKGALKQYSDIFRSAVQGTPKDPKGGILRLIKAFDDYVYDQTDPDLLAARAKEAERRAAEAAKLAATKAAEERLKTARGALDEQIQTLSDLLEEPAYLPKDADSYKSLLGKARDTRKEDIPEAMLAMAGEMKPSIEVLNKAVSEARSKAHAAAFATFLKWLISIGIIGTVLFLIFRRYAEFEELKKRWAEIKANTESQTQNAATNYLDGYSRREGIIAMKDVVGKTKEVWDRATSEVDDIWIGVAALRDRLDKLNQLAARATVINLDPLKQAIDGVTSPFEFDTGTVNKDELFSPAKVMKQIDPIKFQQELAARFKKVVGDWDALQKAADARLQNAMALFPHKGMDELLATASAANIPHKWIDDHPLAGDDASDKSLWDGIDALRWTDPMAFIDKIEECRTTETAIKARLTRLVAVRTAVQQARVESVPALDTVMPPGNDPATTLASARAAEYELDKLFNVNTGWDFEAVEAAGTGVVTLYAKVREQQAGAEHAIKSALQGVGKGQVDLQAATLQSSQAEQTVMAAMRTHAKASDAMEALQAGKSMLARAETELDKARQFLSAKKHFEARTKGDVASSNAKDAVRLFGEAISTCEALDRQKASFEARTRDIARRRNDALGTVTQYGGSANVVPPYRPVNVPTAGLVDYALLTTALVQQEHAWESVARQQQSAYEAEQSRIRAEEARRQAEIRRREEEEAAARRRRQRDEEEARAASYRSSSSSWSSGSSSSGSSWDSGGSSSDGGSSGGGGSSSDGGSWCAPCDRRPGRFPTGPLF
jgi:uncharacterized membrane protein YgcG